MPRVLLVLALLGLPFVVGCEGCRRGDRPDGEANKQEAPLEDFTARDSRVFPADANSLAGGIKPGHWITASQSLKSNQFDVRGELESLATVSAEGAAQRDAAGQPSPAEASTTLDSLPSIRPVVLPKGQLRRFDYRILAPVPREADLKRGYLRSRFVGPGGSTFFETGGQPFNVLSGEEFFFVILTDRPERFAKFQVSDWVRPFRDETSFQAGRANFRIVIPPADDLLPLAETMLDWTNTSVLLWDNLSADALTPGQTMALADWVRFGGQLIVNGADAADALSKTVLADLLPLEPSGNVELDPAAAAALLQGWAVSSDTSTEKQIALLRSQSGRVAVDGRAARDAQALPRSGDLVLSRRVGCGRVVQPRFDVTSDWLVNWLSYDSFINAALLARPRRQLVESESELNLSLIQQRYPELDASLADAAMNSRVRITARDAVLPVAAGDVALGSSATSRLDPLAAIDGVTGVGAWTDDSDVISTCRQILRSESGIEIPESSLVVRSLGYYLLILVPVNYLVFRLLGRLEYAWLAVPLIAIGGAAGVARVARLDIGFARSQTEIALLELQPDYQRGHLARVVAIYNSLSSSYDVEFSTMDAAAAPITADGDADANPGSAAFRTGFSEGPQLTAVAVGSNQVRMLHAEQILDVGGAVELDAEQRLINRTEHELFDGIVVQKSEAGEVQIAIVGPCPSGSSSQLRFRSSEAAWTADELPMQAGRLMMRLAAPAAIRTGSARLIARIDGSLAGMTIRPSANQSAAQTIVLAHLKHAPLPEPQVDLNLVGDLRRVLRDDAVDQDAPTTAPEADQQR